MRQFNLKAFLSLPGPGRTIVYIPRKQKLYRQGARSTAAFYILAGVVKLTVATKGKEVALGLLGPGSFAGKGCIAHSAPRHHESALALTNCTLLRIDRSEMLRAIHREKAFAEFFLDYLLARVNRHKQLLLDQMADSCERRLAHLLLDMAQFGGGAEAMIPLIAQGELAEIVGTTRSRINLFMNRFRKMGLLAYHARGAIRIHTARLTKFAAS